MLRQILTGALQRNKAALLVRTQNYSQSTSSSGDGKNPPVLNHADVPIVDYEDPDYIPLPEYPMRTNEPLEKRKQRLIYQSRKRGMLENDLLLSTFVDKYLKGLNENQTALYDHLINGVTNDWDIYYWVTNVKPTPPEHDNEIMDMLKRHVSNENREQRLRQPNL